jgi:hypothetical protein
MKCGNINGKIMSIIINGISNQWRNMKAMKMSIRKYRKESDNVINNEISMKRK